MRQVANKPYGICQHGFTDIRDVNTPQRRVEGGKQLVCRVDPRFGDAIEKGRFTGVGISHQRNSRNVGFDTRLPPLLTLLFNSFQARLYLHDAITQQTTVGFELGFTRTTQTYPAFLSFKVGPATHQARSQMAQLRQLNLQLTLMGTGTLGENI